MIPHHLAYPAGRRGVNWEAFDEACTPVVEIFSEHGNGEHDRGPYPYFSAFDGRPRDLAHRGGGPRIAGLRFGFVGSSDDHAGFPGAYGEGPDGGAGRRLLARRHLRGDPRAPHLRADRRPDRARPRASTARRWARRSRPAAKSRSSSRSHGRDELDVVEVIQDGRIVHRAHALDAVDAAQQAFAATVAGAPRMGLGPMGRARARSRVRLGDGPRRREWPPRPRVSLPAVDAVRRASPASLSSGAATAGCRSARTAHARARTARTRTRASWSRSTATPRRRSTLALREPVEQQRAASRLGELQRGSHHAFTGPFPSRGLAVAPRSCRCAASSLRGRCTLDGPGRPLARLPAGAPAQRPHGLGQSRVHQPSLSAVRNPSTRDDADRSRSRSFRSACR